MSPDRCDGVSIAYRFGMDEKTTPKDSDPSSMTDFEENATRQQIDDALPSEDKNRKRSEELDHEPDDGGPIHERLKRP